MSSFITTDLKSLVLDLYRQDIDGDGRYYVALSGADSADGGYFGQNQARNEMNIVKIISDKSFVVPNVTWTSGRTYNAYDDNLPNQENFYVINSVNEVYLCIEQAKDNAGTAQPSTVEPTGTIVDADPFGSRQNTFYTSDKYCWRYLFKLTGLASNNFKTLDHIPVSKVELTTSSITETAEQINLQDGSIAGEILGIAIDSAGTGYTFAPTLTIIGNGTNASFTTKLSAGRIVNVTVDSGGGGNLFHGSGYDYAEIKVSGEGGAVLRPIIGPRAGVNADPRETLRSNQFMIYTEIQDDENGTLPLADPVNDFKQAMIIRNPLKPNDSDFTANTGNAMDYFEIENIQDGPFLGDEIVSNNAETRKVKVYWHDTTSTPNRLYYVRNHETGFLNWPDAGIAIVGQTSGAQATITSGGVKTSDINRYSGDVMYLNNLETSIDRTSSQTEDIKIVIDLG